MIHELANNIAFEKFKLLEHVLSKKEYELFRIAKKQSIPEEKVLIERFYPGIKNGNISLWKLKEALRKKLLNIVLVMGPGSKPTEIQKAHHQAYKDFATFQILRGKGKRKVAIKVAERVLQTAVKYQFTELTISIASALELHYGAIIGDKRKMEVYSGLVKKHMEVLRAEQLCQKYYCYVLSNSAKATPSETVKEVAKEYIEELKPLLERFNSYRLHLLAYNLMISVFQFSNDYSRVIETCNEANSYFKNLNYPTPLSTIFGFAYKQIPAFIQLRKFNEASEAIQKCLALVEQDSYSAIIVKKYEVILNFYNGSFLDAYHLIADTKDISDKFDYLREQWLIYEAYSFLLSGVEIEQRFRMGKFLNEVPIYSKDKRGMNINILIIQILFLLKRKKFSQIIDKMEPLKAYTYRHLRRGETYRSNCFLKMLQELPKSNFNRIAVERKTKGLLDNLNQEPINIFSQDPDLEVVPYDQLWQYVLQQLK